MLFVSMLRPQLRFYIQALKECTTFNNWTMDSGSRGADTNSTPPPRPGPCDWKTDWCIQKCYELLQGRLREATAVIEEVLGLFLHELKPAADEKF